MLLSAYDLHHGHVEVPEHAVTELTFLDSGGYETSDIEDLSTAVPPAPLTAPWDPILHAETLAAWPEHIPAAFVSYDDATTRLPLDLQVERALTLFRAHPRQLHSFLIKPETFGARYLDVAAVIPRVSSLAGFHIIGVTEKELGPSYQERLYNLQRLRLALDAASLKAPIHVFGSLDPLSVLLYFHAGAEIFDGLTWLRYAYVDGVATYRQNYAAMQNGLDWSDDFVFFSSVFGNLRALTKLREDILAALSDGDFARFTPHDQVVNSAVRLLAAERERIG